MSIEDALEGRATVNSYHRHVGEDSGENLLWKKGEKVDSSLTMLQTGIFRP
jgi:hypothetical protein